MTVGELDVSGMFRMADQCLGFYTVEETSLARALPHAPAGRVVVYVLVPIPDEASREKARTVAEIIARHLTPAGRPESGMVVS